MPPRLLVAMLFMPTQTSEPARTDTRSLLASMHNTEHMQRTYTHMHVTSPDVTPHPWGWSWPQLEGQVLADHPEPGQALLHWEFTICVFLCSVVVAVSQVVCLEGFCGRFWPPLEQSRYPESPPVAGPGGGGCGTEVDVWEVLRHSWRAEIEGSCFGCFALIIPLARRLVRPASITWHLTSGNQWVF